ncbi:MAG TPA: hypothetical protein RMH99_10715 [Sandaracinaceae bacterium LLY-WYZ-13_1]|nr:hypothetical protein [Sandaracinaceae bacterium LLY-WYZ-13_1]
MGHYTTIARFAKMSARNARQGRSRFAGGRMEASAHPDEAPRVEAPYRCPECGEGAAAAGECARCDVPVYRCDAAIELPAREVPSRRGAGWAWVRGVAVFVTLALFVVATAAVLTHDTTYAEDLWPTVIPGVENYAAYALALTVLFGTLFAGVLGSGTDLGGSLWGVLRRRMAARARRARSRRVPAVEMGKLPARATAPVRVRGRVRVETDEAGRHLVVADGATRCRIRVGDGIDAFDGEGRLRVIEDGAEVEVVGVGERALGAGAAYREARGDFEFTRAELFVRRSD